MQLNAILSPRRQPTRGEGGLLRLVVVLVRVRLVVTSSAACLLTIILTSNRGASNGEIIPFKTGCHTSYSNRTRQRVAPHTYFRPTYWNSVTTLRKSRGNWSALTTD